MAQNEQTWTAYHPFLANLRAQVQSLQRAQAQGNLRWHIHEPPPDFGFSREAWRRMRYITFYHLEAEVSRLHFA